MTVKVADQVWIAAALLTREHPQRTTFRVREIVDRVASERFTSTLQPGIQVHVSQHAVANLPANPGRYRMLFATEDRGRRLFREGDPYHPSREGGKITPRRENIPEQYWDLLEWYAREYAARPPESDAIFTSAVLFDNGAEEARPLLDVPCFDEALRRVVGACHLSGSFVFAASDTSFRSVVKREQRRVGRSACYGVYLVRVAQTGEVLYCGKAGSIDQAGEFGRQDLFERLSNVRGADISADDYFRLWISRAGGPLRIEWYALDTRPYSPALVEAYLLQAHLNEFGCLPSANASL